MADSQRHRWRSGLAKNRKAHSSSHSQSRGRQFHHDHLGEGTTAVGLETRYREVSGLDVIGRGEFECQVNVGFEPVRGGGLIGVRSFGDLNRCAQRCQHRGEGAGGQVAGFSGSDRHPQSLHTAPLGLQTNPLSYRGDRGGSSSTLQPAERRNCVGPADLIEHDPGVALELTHRGLGGGAEDSADPSGVESQRTETELQVGQCPRHEASGCAGTGAVHRGRVRSRSIDRPGGGITDPGWIESVRRLKAADGPGCGGAEVDPSDQDRSGTPAVPADVATRPPKGRGAHRQRGNST